MFAPKARLARLVVPGLPHHVIQRGNRREKTFFEEGDYALYLDLLAESSKRARAESIGRPPADAEWLKSLEVRTGRALAPWPRGPKPQTK